MKRLFCCFAIAILSCCSKTQNLKNNKYQSQCGQDEFVHKNYFAKNNGGVFVDIGAHNGVKFSNTYFFEKELGWKGLCVEPIPEVFSQLKANRECICIQGCISDSIGEKEFLRLSGPSEMLSGLVTKYDPKHLERINKQLSRKGSAENIKVKCYLLNDLLEQNGFSHINFLSVDVEGGEFDILSTIDYSKFNIDVITVENNYGDSRFVPFLAEKGFNLIQSLEQDMIFVNKNFKNN